MKSFGTCCKMAASPSRWGAPAARHRRHGLASCCTLPLIGSVCLRRRQPGGEQACRCHTHPSSKRTGSRGGIAGTCPAAAGRSGARHRGRGAHPGRRAVRGAAGRPARPGGGAAAGGDRRPQHCACWLGRLPPPPPPPLAQTAPPPLGCMCKRTWQRHANAPLAHARHAPRIASCAQVRSTKANDASSRSHLIVRLFIESRPAALDGSAATSPRSPGTVAAMVADAAGSATTSATLTFVDLAGSERGAQVAGEDAEWEKQRQKEVGGGRPAGEVVGSWWPRGRWWAAGGSGGGGGQLVAARGRWWAAGGCQGEVGGSWWPCGRWAAAHQTW